MDIRNLRSTESREHRVPDRRPVVLVDIDDVLCVHQKYNTREILAALAGKDEVHSELVFGEIFHAAARANLRQLDDEFKPYYVITSSWAEQMTQEQFRETFTRTGLGFVAENLHPSWVTPRDEDSYRLVEIDAWLDTCGLLQLSLYAPAPFVILDDELSGQSLTGSHLEGWTVFCEPSIGFINSKLLEAQNILRRQTRRPSSD